MSIVDCQLSIEKLKAWSGVRALIAAYDRSEACADGRDLVSTFPLPKGMPHWDDIFLKTEKGILSGRFYPVNKNNYFFNGAGASGVSKARGKRLEVRVKNVPIRSRSLSPLASNF